MKDREIELRTGGRVVAGDRAVDVQLDADDAGGIAGDRLNRNVVAFVVRAAAGGRGNYDGGFGAAYETATGQDGCAYQKREERNKKRRKHAELQAHPPNVRDILAGFLDKPESSITNMEVSIAEVFEAYKPP